VRLLCFPYSFPFVVVVVMLDGKGRDGQKCYCVVFNEKAVCVAAPVTKRERLAVRSLLSSCPTHCSPPLVPQPFLITKKQKGIDSMAKILAKY